MVRDRGTLSRVVYGNGGGKIENVFRIQIMNATETTQRFHLSVEGLPGLTVASEADLSVEPTQSRWIAVRLQLPYEGAEAGSHAVRFHIDAPDLHDTVTEKAVFIVPQ